MGAHKAIRGPLHHLLIQPFWIEPGPVYEKGVAGMEEKKKSPFLRLLTFILTAVLLLGSVLLIFTVARWKDQNRLPPEALPCFHSGPWPQH